MSTQTSDSQTVLDRAVRKAFWRLLPLCFVCYVIAYVDRANVSFAALTMGKDLAGFDKKAFGFGAGVFFWGYFLLEIPGTVLVERWSARKWITRIMVTWGIIAAATSMVTTPTQFYVLRFLLGLAEAGFFPGMIVFLTHWFPSKWRAKAVATFIIATPTAQIISAPISGNIVSSMNYMGFHGWQWLYIIWGLPAVVLGVVVFLVMTDRPRQAKWLTAEERDALEAELEREKAVAKKKRRMTLLEGLSHPKVLLLCLVYVLGVMANYSLDFFLPSIIKAWYKTDPKNIGYLSVLPPMLALCGQLFMGWSSDRTKERRLHTVVPMLIAAAALMVVGQSRGNLTLTIMLFMVAAAGIKSYQPSFWTLPPLLLTETAGAASIGLINSVGNLGGFFGPNLMGQVKEFSTGLSILGGGLILAALIVFFLGVGHRVTSAAHEPA
jgi:MFS transporter, ACS family, tartrate transporter